MLRIERSGNGQVLFTLSGRIEGEVQELQKLIASEKPGQQLIFNLRDATLVNQDAVKFLAHLRGTWHHARKLSAPHPNVDRSSERSTQTAADVTKSCPSA